jgi:GWxTD domain-containing protein
MVVGQRNIDYNRKVKKSALFWLFLSQIILSGLSLPAQTKKSVKDLPPAYRKWLQEEVVYIISPKEKDVFLRLENDRQRDVFIEAFWKVRDPNPTTPENEFKTEHYRRINYANQNFGKDTPGPGWRSDMGRIYITLGEPKSIDKLENLSNINPVIIWFYSGMAEYGLPGSFDVVFFRKSGTGPYELYSPLKYGPQYLLVNYNGDMTDYTQAYNQLYEIDPQIAGLSLSLIEGESLQVVAPSIASEILLTQRIPAAGYDRIKDTYAEKLLAYKDIIEVDYSANYIDNDALVLVLQDPAGLFFVHYDIEPKKLTFERFENRFLSNLEVNGSVKDLQGNTVYQFDRTVPIEMNAAQVASIQAKLFSFQDMFPLLGGRYKLNLLFKNTVSKEFTSVETDITVPETPALAMSPIILASRIDRESKYKGQNKPFLTPAYQLLPTPRHDFTAKDLLFLYFQVRGLTSELQETGTLDYGIFRETQKVRTLAKPVKDYGSSLNFLEEFSLADLPPANYEVRVSLLDNKQTPVLTEHAFFFVSYQTAVPRPWVLSLTKPPDDSPEILNTLGVQSLNKKDLVAARSYLERAYRMDPKSPQFAMDYCRALVEAKEYARIKQVALPLVQAGRSEFLQILGEASQALGELAEAVGFYKEYLNRYGTNISVLNAIGDCYNQLGDVAQALVAWEKSLELNPNQDKIKAQVKTLKEKK